MVRLQRRAGGVLLEGQSGMLTPRYRLACLGVLS